MKTILLGLCTFLTFQCFAQNGKFAVQFTQNTDFELECGAFNGIGAGVQGIFKLSPRFGLSTGLNFKKMGANGSYTYQDETLSQSVTVGWVGRGLEVPSLDVPLVLHYQFLQKNKWSIQMNAGMRSKFALKRTEIQVPQFDKIDFVDYRAFAIFADAHVEHPSMDVFEFPDFPSFEPIQEDIILVQEKGFTGLDVFAGFGVTYTFSPLWSLAMNANLNVFAIQKKNQLVDSMLKEQTSSGVNVGEMRVGLSLVRGF